MMNVLNWTPPTRAGDMTNLAIARRAYNAQRAPLARWQAAHGDDIRALRDDIDAGRVSFDMLEMTS